MAKTESTERAKYVPGFYEVQGVGHLFTVASDTPDEELQSFIGLALQNARDVISEVIVNPSQEHVGQLGAAGFQIEAACAAHEELEARQNRRSREAKS